MAAGRRTMPFGAELEPDGQVRFRLWAPDAERVDLAIGRGNTALRYIEMSVDDEGWYELTTPEATIGTRYRYLIDRRLLVPDPASRFQPDGTDGPSEVIDAGSYDWLTQAWRGRSWAEIVLYELHLGTFSARGDFAGAVEKLPYLAELGITAIELMPVATFAGARGWGYDGVLPYAPHPAYGTPDSFRHFVDEAHALEISVLLDVVYNHFGPEGNYLHAYASDFFTERHRTPWGAAINFDGRASRHVRDFFIHNALYWLDEFRLDGLRLDAVHAIADDSEPHILDELADAVRSEAGADRDIHLVLENHANEAHYLRPGRGRPPRYTAQWNDDFHHACHTLVTGETDGYYADYADNPIDHLARCLAEGFAYQGEPSRHAGGAARGEPSTDLVSTAFIAFLQNHDQVGNRAHGDRLVALAETGPLRAVTTVMLLAPSIPGLFMGEEFGCRQPFLYFADFEGELAHAVREGRRREFASFGSFAAGDGVPDPIDIETCRRSTLDWSAPEQSEHRDWLRLYQALLAARRRHIVPRLPAITDVAPRRIGERGLVIGWRLDDGSKLTLLANLGPGAVEIGETPPPAALIAEEPPHPDHAARRTELGPWCVRWCLEETEA